MLRRRSTPRCNVRDPPAHGLGFVARFVVKVKKTMTKMGKNLKSLDTSASVQFRLDY